MNRFAALAAAAVATLGLAGPALAQDTPPPPPPPPTSYFFSCVADSKYQGNQPNAWTTTAPAASYTTGAGCGSADIGVYKGRLGGQEVDFFGGGAHSGVINAINVELHSLLLSQLRVASDIGGSFELRIDGEQVAIDESLRIAGEVSASGLTDKYTFSFSRKKPAGQPVAPPLAGEGDHTIEVRFSSRFADYQHLWVWGASEIPAGVVVNPAKLSSPKIVV